MPRAEEAEDCRKSFPMQRRLHSSLSPNLLEKQFSDRYEKNNVSIVSLEIASHYKLEKGEKKGKKS